MTPVLSGSSKAKGSEFGPGKRTTIISQRERERERERESSESNPSSSVLSHFLHAFFLPNLCFSFILSRIGFYSFESRQALVSSLFFCFLSAAIGSISVSACFHFLFHSRLIDWLIQGWSFIDFVLVFYACRMRRILITPCIIRYCCVVMRT